MKYGVFSYRLRIWYGPPYAPRDSDPRRSLTPRSPNMTWCWPSVGPMMSQRLAQHWVNAGGPVVGCCSPFRSGFLCRWQTRWPPCHLKPNSCQVARGELRCSPGCKVSGNHRCFCYFLARFGVPYMSENVVLYFIMFILHVMLVFKIVVYK